MNFVRKITLATAILSTLNVSAKKETESNSTSTIELKTLADSASYALGVNLGQQLKNQGFELNIEALTMAIKNTLNDKDLQITQENIFPILQNYSQELNRKKFQTNIDESEKFLNENKKRKEVITTASGLQYEIITEGNGEKPGPTDKVKVHYHGTLINGKVFDSSVNRGEPITFGVNQVIKGWTEALQLMPVGSKWKLYIPAELAYGANPRPGGVIEPYMALIFEVELISIQK